MLNLDRLRGAVFTMSSVSSLVTTAASDESSSADSGRSSRTQKSNPRGSKLRHRRASSTTKLARSGRAKSEIAKRQRVVCGCKMCEGKRMVSRSTSYRHLRIEAEIAEDDAKWEARWSFDTPTSPALWLFKPEYQC